MLPRNEHDYRTLTHQADPAALLSEHFVDTFIAAAVANPTQEVAHKHECCECGRTMRRKTAADAEVLTNDGLVKVIHVPHECNTRTCGLRGKMVWANFFANARGSHTWIGGTARPDVAMLTPHFGVTWKWHEQFSRRILHHHASFMGESRTHQFETHGHAHGHDMIANAWLKLQLLKRWPRISDEPFCLSQPFSAIFHANMEKYTALVHKDFQSAAGKPTAAVIDGNQKNTRRTCAELMTEMKAIPGTNLFYMQDCGRTPKRKRAFCSEHDRSTVRDNGVRIFKKHCIAETSQDLLGSKPPRAVDLGWPLRDWVRDQIHFQSKNALASKPNEDLDVDQAADFVSCRTSKMPKRISRRSGGWLVACNESGIVMAAEEFYGGESLTQRAAFTAKLIHDYASIETIVHDDSCHLRQFMGHWLKTQPRLCFPRVHYIVDHFHSKGHVDTWCQQNCSPLCAGNAERMAHINSSACEILFSWLSGYKASFRHMNRMTGHFFIHEVLLLRNAWNASRANP